MIDYEEFWAESATVMTFLNNAFFLHWNKTGDKFFSSLSVFELPTSTSSFVYSVINSEHHGKIRTLWTRTAVLKQRNAEKRVICLLLDKTVYISHFYSALTALFKRLFVSRSICHSEDKVKMS